MLYFQGETTKNNVNLKKASKQGETGENKGLKQMWKV